MKPKVTARSTNTPPLSGAEAFARLLVAAMAKKPELKVIAKVEKPNIVRTDDYTLDGVGVSDPIGMDRNRAEFAK